MNKLIRIIGFCAIAVGVIGCVSNRFAQPTAAFQDSVNLTAAAVGSYFTGLNQFERSIYLDERLYDPALEVLASDAEGEPTPLLFSVFDAESIKARMDALSLIGVYARRLNELATSDAPRQFAAGAKTLGENLFGLQKTFEKLGKSEAGKASIDQSAKEYSGPIGTIVGVIGEMYMETEKEKAIKLAVAQGAPQVRRVLSLLRQDLEETIDPLQATGLQQMLADRMRYYNERRGEDLERRRKMLAEIESTADRYEAAVTANPADLIRSMADAHEALVKFAESPPEIANFAELLAALEAFRDHALAVSEAVRLIRNQ